MSSPPAPAEAFSVVVLPTLPLAAGASSADRAIAVVADDDAVCFLHCVRSTEAMQTAEACLNGETKA